MLVGWWVGGVKVENVETFSGELSLQNYSYHIVWVKTWFDHPVFADFSQTLLVILVINEEAVHKTIQRLWKKCFCSFKKKLPLFICFEFILYGSVITWLGFVSRAFLASENICGKLPFRKMHNLHLDKKYLKWNSKLTKRKILKENIGVYLFHHNLQTFVFSQLKWCISEEKLEYLEQTFFHKKKLALCHSQVQ